MIIYLLNITVGYYVRSKIIPIYRIPPAGSHVIHASIHVGGK